MTLGSSALAASPAWVRESSIMASRPFGPPKTPVKLSEASSSASNARLIVSVSSRLTGLNMV